jgi:hypothetical protein
VAALHPNATKEERGGAGAHKGRPYQTRNPARFPAPGTLREFEFHECTDLRGRVKRKFARPKRAAITHSCVAQRSDGGQLRSGHTPATIAAEHRGVGGKQ